MAKNSEKKNQTEETVVEETNELFPIGETVMYLEVPSYSYIQIDGGNLYFDSYAVNV